MSLRYKSYLVFIIAALLSFGAVVSAFLEIGDVKHFNILEVTIPRIFLLGCAFAVILRYVIPQYLLKGKYGNYILLSGVICICTSIVSMLIENYIHILHGEKLVNNDLGVVQIWGYIISNSALLFLLIIGISGLILYKKWRHQFEIETNLANSYKEYIAILKSRFDSFSLMLFLDEIINNIKENNGYVQEQISNLSENLRHQLYDLSPISQLKGNEENIIQDTRITNFIISKRTKSLRWVCLELMIVLVSIGAFSSIFVSGLSLISIIGFVVSVVVLNLIVMTNVYFLFPYYIKRRNLTHYLIVISIPVIFIGVISLIANFVSYNNHSAPGLLLGVIATVSSYGSTVALGLFWVGVAGILCIQHWMRTDKRIATLSVNNKAVEYSILQKQLNPHFLFNALNNIDFLLEEDSTEAANMLSELKTLLQYHLADSEREYTTIYRELEYIKSYLSLEKMRHDIFDFDIKYDGITDFNVPSLLFMPFVENAVKYSSVINNTRQIRITVVDCGETICFSCENSFHQTSWLNKNYGGIGLNNTKRRLDLLFGQTYTLKQTILNDTFISILKFPKVKL